MMAIPLSPEQLEGWLMYRSLNHFYTISPTLPPRWPNKWTLYYLDPVQGWLLFPPDETAWNKVTESLTALGPEKFVLTPDGCLRLDEFPSIEDILVLFWNAAT